MLKEIYKSEEKNFINKTYKSNIQKTKYDLSKNIKNNLLNVNKYKK